MAKTKCILAMAIPVSVCLSVRRRIPRLLHGPGCNLGEWQEVPSSCALLADLQSVHGFRCDDNIHVCQLKALYTANAYSVEREVSASARILLDV